ncbi:uncharacterized protein LOC143039134 [Oratosquilla oratoria]|uniref:uncharacterized protein LOC143039134 n=1 Tax=Oratosquilla oratoria TaxID=337810 RepID=UPI003F7764C2
MVTDGYPTLGAPDRDSPMVVFNLTYTHPGNEHPGNELTPSLTPSRNLTSCAIGAFRGNDPNGYLYDIAVTSDLLQFVILAALVVVAAAAPKPDSPPPYGYPAPHPPVYKEPGMPYDFAYAVKDEYSGNDFAHDEKSDGDVTSGSYRVALPDGRTQIVTFTADHHKGFVADVTYEGEASYPPPAPYHPPPPPAYA